MNAQTAYIAGSIFFVGGVILAVPAIDGSLMATLMSAAMFTRSVAAWGWRV